MIMLMKNSASRSENKEARRISLLDLPECTLDCILERLSPVDLCSLAAVCTSLKHRCRSDGLWEKHIKKKWGKVLGDVAHKEWQRHITRIMNENLLLQQNHIGFLGSFSGVWPSLCLGSYLVNSGELISLLLSNCSNMALYVSLQRGGFWFPAQVYRGVRLYCYDALLSYDFSINTFRARSPTNGWRLIEENIRWNRIRISPVETSSYAFYVSNCLNDLKPGDHVEIQRRRHKEQPYDWHYAVVGHLESCAENENPCHCQYTDMLAVEFNHYHRGSRWNRAVLNKNMDGEQRTRYCFSGGIRKLCDEEIERWNCFRTTQNA